MKIAKYQRSAGAFILAALPDQRVKLTVIIGLEFAPESNLGTHSKKNYGIIWEFFPSGGPPTSQIPKTPFFPPK